MSAQIGAIVARTEPGGVRILSTPDHSQISGDMFRHVGPAFDVRVWLGSIDPVEYRVTYYDPILDVYDVERVRP